MKNKGFTLIELLAVILILGIIALIAIPTVNNIIQESRKGAMETTGNNLIDSAESYYQMCQIRDGFEADGTTACTLSGLAALDEAAMKAKLNIKGDIPAATEITAATGYFGYTTTGDAVIKFKSGNFTCSNGTYVTTVYAVTGDGSVKCTKS